MAHQLLFFTNCCLEAVSPSEPGLAWHSSRERRHNPQNNCFDIVGKGLDVSSSGYYPAVLEMLTLLELGETSRAGARRLPSIASCLPPPYPLPKKKENTTVHGNTHRQINPRLKAILENTHSTAGHKSYSTWGMRACRNPQTCTSRHKNQCECECVCIHIFFFGGGGVWRGRDG